MVIADIGCAGGDLLAAIHQKLPQARLIGIDIMQQAVADSQHKIPYGRFINSILQKISYLLKVNQ
ncbi:MAG: hypothetical protein ETSY2_49000 [Candidatus Entotheonella gemina]|uniref:tRNA (guanine(46)-N(7))-methyltransferase n=1 Tax=Candidatus Entotheonella gemina TaxID=1429439 RepID=W4L9W4_9BACT|nr:MAG: hypothetical protein ETSY2_49000 [Candidatus Entotheonella gemina]